MLTGAYLVLIPADLHLHFPGLEPTSTTPEGQVGEEGCLQAVQVLPPLLAKGFPAPVPGQSLGGPLSAPGAPEPSAQHF